MVLYLRHQKWVRLVAVFLAANLLFQLFLPATALALTSGPASPEFSSFEPVATTDMVNPFTGDFTYNLPVLEIPGPDGGGYAMSLSYHSGSSPEEESSWTGYGWTLNPGAINRNTRGFPDDYSNTVVQQYNKSRPSWSASVSRTAGADIFSKKIITKDSEEGKSETDTVNVSFMNLSIRNSLRYNNYQGFARYLGFGVGVKGLGNVDMNRGAEGVTFSADLNNPKEIFQKKKKAEKQESKVAFSFDYRNSLKKMAPRFNAKSFAMSNLGSTYGLFSFSEAVRATSMANYRSISYNTNLGISINLNLPVGVHGGQSANFTLHQSTPEESLLANGYMHNPGEMKEGALSDYYVEKGNPHSKRDLYLGIPFTNADNFMVTGEGLGGGFRFYADQVGHFYPNQIENKTKIRQGGFELGIGGSIGIGLHFGIGSEKGIVKNWSEPGNTNNYRFTTNDGRFRFNHDMGGNMSYGNTSIEAADMYTVSSVPGAKIIEPQVTAQASHVDTAGVGASSYIAYRTYGQVSNQPDLRFNKSTNRSTTNPGNPASVAEVSVHNADGLQYIYGLPIYTRNETNLQVDVAASEVPADRYIAHKNLSLTSTNNKYTLKSEDHKAALGEIRPTAYATSYLITQIVTPDYVDVSNNGPDASDFGGWTQFHYHQKKWNTNPWYRWRMPYTGLLYNQGQISDKKDDMGSVMAGEREVYYLQSIETKSHIAFFVTNQSDAVRWSDLLTKLNLAGKINPAYLSGSKKERLDGLGAQALSSTGDPAASNPAGKGNQQLEYLEKIVLFAKARPERPLKTTRFAYDYQLVANLPNHQDGKYPKVKDNGALHSGKLTLKKVWFEYEGVVNARISPYEFIYTYKEESSFPQSIRTSYPTETQASTRYSDYAQNPDYTPHLLDPWGNMQIYGKERKKHQVPWVYQGPLPAGATTDRNGWRKELPARQTAKEATREFDPAAWQLKQIRLPSGGEILVEYEQKDYAFVQNRLPMAMASLLKADEPMEGLLKTQYGSTPTYVINTRDLGLDPQSPGYEAELNAQIDAMKKYFAEEKIYFKYLYAMLDWFGAADLNSCLSEYITGYAIVDDVKQVVVPMGSASVAEKHIAITLKGESSRNGNRTAVPRQACYEYYTTQRLGKWMGQDCDTEFDSYDRMIAENANSLLNGNIFTRMAVVDPLLSRIGGALSDIQYKIPEKSEVGTHLNLSLSYLRLPMIKAKKGGGVRVKRLMLFDPGIETGDAALYGQEYRYETLARVNGQTKIISSGIATNEPSDAREENPLITFMPRKGQSWYSRITAGEDKEQTEGPLGETLLPAASVGHSRIVVQNIHQGITGTGYTVHEYYTVKDYPFDHVYVGGQASDFRAGSPGVAATSLPASQKRDFLRIPAGFFFYEVNKMWATQGYRFIINNMHGQIRQVSSYPGTYQASNYIISGGQINSLVKPISSQAYQYYTPGEKLKMLYPDGSYKLEVPGKEMEVTMEMKSVLQQTMDLSLDLDITIGLAPPLPVIVSASPRFAYYNKGINTHVTSKVLRYPAIVKRVTATQDGVVSTTENLAFNAHTGQVVLTKTSDGFDGVMLNGAKHDGSMYALMLPASWYYPAMGQKSKDSLHTNELGASAGSVVSYGSSGNPLYDTNKWRIPQQGVLNASAQTFRKDWFLSTSNETSTAIASEYANITSASARLNNVWRAEKSYIYRTDAKSATATGKVYQAGVLEHFEPFRDWHRGTTPVPDQSRWIASSSVTHYSPNGQPLEEQNVLGIYSAARFGYDQQLPVMMAQNARYTAIHFMDYENSTGLGSTDVYAHSGTKSRMLTEPTEVIMDNVIVAPNAFPKGALFKLWVKSDAIQEVSLQVGQNSSFPLVQIAQTGQWALYSGVISPALLPSSGTLTLSLVSHASLTAPLYIDDVRLQPKEAQGTCYVYDASTLKLLTQFDDQHFGLYYQYNDEGKLVRKLIETERGLKAVQETQYNVPKKSTLPQP